MSTAAGTLVGYTTREHTVSLTDRRTKELHSFERIPAGTEVYVSRIRADHTCEIRIPGTLLTGRVYLSQIRPA